MDPPQDPHLRIHVSTSLCLRLRCKIHVSGFMSQPPCVSQDPLQDPCCRIHSSAAICIPGSSTRSTSSDSCLSIFVSHGFSARSTSPDSCLSIFISQDPLQDPCLRIHVSDSCLSIHQFGSPARSMSPGSCLSIFVSQDSLQDPCLRIHVSASTNMDPLHDPRLRIHVSASLYLRLLCKIHVSGSVYKHPYVSQDPLQDPCLRFMSQHLFISGSSARSMSPGSCLSIFISQDPLQDPCLRIHISASICISGSSARSMSPGSCLSIFASQDPLQDPCLRIHVSASSYLRILCKIHVFGLMSQHLRISGSSARSMCPVHVFASVSASICISGSSTRSTSSDSCLTDSLQDPRLRTHVSASLYLRILRKILQDPCLRIHVSDSCLSIHQYGSSARSMSPDSCLSIFISQDSLQDPCLRIHVSASTNMEPLQDPRLRIHVSASLYLSILCKIHVSGPIYIYISASIWSSARSMSPGSCLNIFASQDPLQDPCLRIHVSASSYCRTLCKIHVSDSCLSIHWCLSIHVYLRILCKIHVSGSISQQPYVSQDPLQDPCLRIHVSASLYLTDSLQDPRLRIHVSASLYLRILCKIHVSGSMCPIHVLASTNMDPLQDPCLRTHVSASLYLRILYKIHVFGFMSEHPLIWILYKIHVFGFMSQHLCLSGVSTRSMSSGRDPLERFAQAKRKILTSGGAFCVALRRENNPTECFAQAKRTFWPAETRFVWPCAEKTVRPRSVGAFRAGKTQILTSGEEKQSARVFRAGETEILTCRDAFFVALRRRNANLTSRDASCVHIRWIHEEARPDEGKSPRRYSETPKKIPSNRFAQAKRKFWPPEWRFLWPCAVKNEGDKKKSTST